MTMLYIRRCKDTLAEANLFLDSRYFHFIVFTISPFLEFHFCNFLELGFLAIHFMNKFLALQNSSIGDLVIH